MAKDKPNLGLATTRELLNEIRARIDIHAFGGLDYRTVDGGKMASGRLTKKRAVSSVGLAPEGT